PPRGLGVNRQVRACQESSFLLPGAPFVGSTHRPSGGACKQKAAASGARQGGSGDAAGKRAAEHHLMATFRSSIRGTSASSVLLLGARAIANNHADLQRPIPNDGLLDPP